MDKRGIVFLNLIWRFLERTGAQLVSFIVSIILARLLLPEEYSIVALAVVVITFLNVFIDSGLGNALIQKKECDNVDYSTALWANLAICIILYLILFFILAPFMAWYYSSSVLMPVIRVMGISIIASSIKNVQQAYVSRALQFKKFFLATSVGTIISAGVGISMAYAGYGVWALACQYLSNVCIDMIVLGMVIEWRPKLVFSYTRFKVLISYGYKLLLSSLINCTYDNFRQLIIGKIYQPSQLAYYNRGKQFPSLIMVNINTSIDSVLFPVMSKEQDDMDRLQRMAKESLAMSSFLLFPLLFGLAAVSEHMVPLVLTDKWNGTIIFIQIFSLFYLFHPMQTTNLNLIKAVGRSDLFLKLEIVQTIVGVSLLLPVINKGPVWIATMYAVAAVFNSILIGTTAGSITGYKFISQIRDITPYFIMSAVMGTLTYSLGMLSENHWIILGQILFGIFAYFVLAVIIHPFAFTLALSMVRKKK